MREVLELLEAAPGSSPWYLDAPSACLTSSHGSLRWTFESGAVGAIGGGVSVLRSADGQPLALLGYNCFVKHLAGHRFLVWYQADAASLGDLGRDRDIHLQVVDADLLEPIDDIGARCTKFSESRSSTFFAAGVVDELAIPGRRSAGGHAQVFPGSMHHLSEVLLLDHTALSLVAAYPALGRVEVFPQDWLQQGSFDHGYQWVTRVARDPADGSIVGEGFRLGVFRLDETDRRIERWLIQDPFFRRAGPLCP